MSTQETTSKNDQYTLWQILGIWAAATVPLALTFWVIVPVLGPRVAIHQGLFYMSLMVASLIWQGVLSYILLRREVKPFTWQGVKDRLWLQSPSNPRTGRPSKWLFLWLIPLIAYSYWGFNYFQFLSDLWVKTFPFLASRPYAELQNLATIAKGQWWMLGFVLVQLVFNYRNCSRG